MIINIAITSTDPSHAEAEILVTRLPYQCADQPENSKGSPELYTADIQHLGLH